MGRKPRRRNEGQGSVYEARPGVWAIRWRFNGKRKAKVGFESRAEAEAVMATIAARNKAKRNGTDPDPSTIPPLSTFFDEWLEGRKVTHRAWKDDRSRWKSHLAKPYGEHGAMAERQPSTITPADLEIFIQAKLRDEVNPATVGHCIRLLSRLFAFLVRHSERTGVKSNPVRALDKAVRRLYRPKHDPKDTPFLESLDDARRLLAALEAPYSVMFAVGLYAGLRPGEIRALSWADVNLDRRRIKVSRQLTDGTLGPLKDDETRVVPILDPLVPILTEWREKTGGKGFLFHTVAPKVLGRVRDLRARPVLISNEHTLLAALDRAFVACKLPRVTWYQATRHTFASHWVLRGGSLERLAAVLGHSSTWVTERYAHLKPDLFLDEELERFGPAVVAVPQSPRGGTDAGASGHQVATVSASVQSATSKSA